VRARPTIATDLSQRGLTVLEMMVSLAIIGGITYVGYSAVRKFTRADLVDDTNRLAAIMSRASELAAETGHLHRVVIDADEDVVTVESCSGNPGVQRLKPGEKPLTDKEVKDKLADAKGKLQATKDASRMQQGMMATTTPADDEKTAAAVAGHHVGDQTCTTVVDVWSGDDQHRPLVLKLQKDAGIKPKQVWVQHRDDSVTSGKSTIYFFPLGSAERAIVELTDGDAVYSVRVYGLSGRIETIDGDIPDAADIMKRDATGTREAER
jgi:prepilin-type N-terminal cleavage/methylation domain-containing protein